METVQLLIGICLLAICYFITKTQGKGYKNKSREYKNINIDKNIEIMTDREFEFYCAKLLSMMGYSNVKVTKATGDCGRDIECTKNGREYFCEVKHFNLKNSTGRPLLMKLVGAGTGERVNKFIFITSSYFTEQAKEYAKSVDMILIDRNSIYNISRNTKNSIN